MRHDPAGASIVIMLRSLKLYGMANAVEDLGAQGAPAFEAAIPMLSQLLKAEIAEREVRSIAYHTKIARFPAYKDLSGFDFTSSEINEAKVRQLHRCEFIEAAENVVLIGGPGTGKATLQPLSAFKRSNITGGRCASSQPWSWSMHWSKRRRSARLGNWPRC